MEELKNEKRSTVRKGSGDQTNRECLSGPCKGAEVKAGSDILMVTITKDPEIKGHFLWSKLIITDPITFCLMIVDGQPVVKICA